MGKSLIVTEKSSVAKEIAKVLGVTDENKGGYYENGQYVISWAAGHLFSLGYPEDQNENWKDYRLDTLPMFPDLKVFPLAQTKKQLNVLVSLIGREDVDEIINAGDAGIEGEGIQWEIYEYAFQKNRRRKRVRRLWISSVSDNAIREGFKNLEPEGSRECLYKAFLARRNGDWIYGMNTSRFFGLTYNVKGFSSGSVKNQILGLVVKRCRDIKNFVSKPYYQVSAGITVNQGLIDDPEHDLTCGFSAMWYCDEGNRLSNPDDAKKIIEKVSCREGVVTRYEVKEKAQKPPTLYNLAKIQSDAVKKYGITSDRTLEILQALYLDYKITTYPRTDSEYITEDDAMEVPELIRAIASSLYLQSVEPNISTMASKIIEDGLELSNITNDKKVSDHPGLFINENFGAFDIRVLKKDEQQVLLLLLKRILISLAKKYEYTETTVEIMCKDEFFTNKGKTPIHNGYLDIQRKLFPSSLEKNEHDSYIPFLKEGQVVHIKHADLLSKMTTPPPYFNESTLISAMENISSIIEDKELKSVMREKKGIGTSATRATIFKELLDRKYLYKDDSKNKKTPSILPTEMGEKIFDILPSDMTTPELAAKWQDMLNQIQKGEITYDLYMQEMKTYINNIISGYQKIGGIGLEKTANKPTDKQLNLAKSISMTLNISMPEEQTITSISSFINDNMGQYLANPNKKYATVYDNVVGKCPLCGGEVNVSKDASRYYCSQYKSGCKFSVMKEDYAFKNLTKKNVTKAVMKSLLEKGQIKILGKLITVKWNTGTTPKGFMTHTFTIK